MRLRTRAIFVLLPLLLAACTGGTGDGGGGGRPTPTPTATPLPPGEGDTPVIGEAGLCTPGDVARVDFDPAGRNRFTLKSDNVACAALKDNRVEEYTLILYNTTGGPLSFKVSSPVNESPPATSSSLRALRSDEDTPPLPPRSTHGYPVGVSRSDEIAAELARSYRINRRPRLYGQAGARTLAATRTLSVNDEVEFKVRCDLGDPDTFCTTSAILRAQGGRINIFVDRDHPFIQAGPPRNADTLTGAQLDRAVQIFERNTYPLETALLGTPSDVDGDSRINVLITPIINRHLRVSSFIGTSGYTDSRNVLPYDPVANAGSNESEVIFVYAPDSLGNYGQSFGRGAFTSSGPSAAAYVSKELNAWIAFGLNQLISFNQHVLVRGGSAEDGWIRDGIGAVMADLAGFNIWRNPVYEFFLTRPQLFDLRQASDVFNVNTIPAGYMFMLYYIQSQVDTAFQDADGDTFDDDLNKVLSNLMTSGTTSIENLEQAVEYDFDAAKETEFQAIFKDWTIALVTSGLHRQDLQQAGVTALKYYFGLNPSVYGTSIATAAGSARAGADGGIYDVDANPNSVGIDLNLLHPAEASCEKDVLIENADEHVFAPGNTFFGYIDPFAAMYVRLAGLFQSKQTISLRGSSSAIKGFLVRRSDISYPHVYAESTFGAIDQHAEDMDAAGPNPYWGSRKIDLAQMVADPRLDSDASKDFLSIVGQIDTTTRITVCSEDFETGCSLTDVPDTDKYIFRVPDLGLAGEEGSLAVVVRRQFDDGSDLSALKPLLAIVSSKDVPYPYVPHPVRGTLDSGAVTVDSRQQYRWLTSKLVCGDGDANQPTHAAGITCPTDPLAAENPAPRVAYEGLVENTGEIFLPDLPGSWVTGISGGDCDDTPDVMGDADARPLGVDTVGYGSGYFPVTGLEESPSSLGRYPWSGYFMEISYVGAPYPDILFAREFLSNVPAYPSVKVADLYDPRSTNAITMNCQVTTGDAPDTSPDSPDDFLAANEIKKPAKLAEQILTEMSRGRKANADGLGFPGEAGHLDPQFDDNDIFAIDGDSRDNDTECSWIDEGNNMNTRTVRRGEGALLIGSLSGLEPHIQGNLNVSAIAGNGQEVYRTDGSVVIRLTPGKSYTLIVGGVENTVGKYELRLRRIDQSYVSLTRLFLAGSCESCGALGFPTLGTAP